MSHDRLVYDDDCGFCGWWADWAAARGPFDLVGFSALTAEDRARLPADYERCAHLIVGDRVLSCGAAVEAVLRRVDSPVRWPARAFSWLPEPLRAGVREPLYRAAADRRSWFGRYLHR